MMIYEGVLTSVELEELRGNGIQHKLGGLCRKYILIDDDCPSFKQIRVTTQKIITSQLVYPKACQNTPIGPI